MSKNVRSIVLMAALAVVLVAGVVAQQKSADTAVDPVCGMTVVKANAKATFDYKGTTYYFCSTGCKDSFAKEPEKYLAAMKAKAAAPKEVQGQPMPMGGGMGMMHGGQGMGQGMANCPMMGQKQMMHGGMGMHGGGMMAAPGMGMLFRLYGDKLEMAVENTKDGAVLKVTSKDPEVIKAIQVHMAEHMAMMKKMKENAAKAPAAGTAVKAPAEAACADCPMKK
jgi:YHS domain-containing protein